MHSPPAVDVEGSTFPALHVLGSIDQRPIGLDVRCLQHGTFHWRVTQGVVLNVANQHRLVFCAFACCFGTLCRFSRQIVLIWCRGTAHIHVICAFACCFG